MSRTITIPKNNKPFIVNINNREYIYRGGETVEVPDEVAEVIEDTLELEPKPISSGYSKIATYTVKKGADGSIPNRVTINKDDNGKPFRIKDFFLKMKLSHTIEGVTTANLLVRGMVDDVVDTRCSSGHCQLRNLSKDSFTQYYARFVTCGKGGGGVLMVSKDAFSTDYLYGTTPHFSGECAYMSPTEPDVSLDDGMNTIIAVMFDANMEETPFAEGCTFELWGERL